jgi:phytoene synthase
MTPAEADAHCAAELRARDRDRWLAVLWSPAAARPGLTALFALDLALWDVVATTTDPRIGEIRLAWWRERLDALGDGPPPTQPVLIALDSAVLRGTPMGPCLSRGVTTAPELSSLEDGALLALGGNHDAAARLRGPRLFAIAARVLGADAPDGLGHAWAAGEAARAGHGVSPPGRLPGVRRALRPLRGLDRLGARDVVRSADASERRGSLARQLVLARSALFG